MTLHFSFVLLQLFANFISGGTCRPHPYRKRPTLGNVSNQHIHQSMQQSYSLGYQDSYSPEYASLHQVTTKIFTFSEILNVHSFSLYLHCYIRDCCRSSLCPTAGLPCSVMRFVLMPSGCSPQEPLAHLYEQQENIDTGALAGFSQQVLPTVLFQGYINKGSAIVKLHMLEHNTDVIWFVCPSSSLVSPTTVSRVPTTVILPAHPCLTSAREPRPPVLVASQIASSTG